MVCFLPMVWGLGERTKIIKQIISFKSMAQGHISTTVQSSLQTATTLYSFTINPYVFVTIINCTHAIKQFIVLICSLDSPWAKKIMRTGKKTQSVIIALSILHP